jgi:TrmH family RNA methyltransferase
MKQRQQIRPPIVRIHSENNDFQYVETLRRNREKRHKHREKRHKHREFFVEGVRPINLMLQYHWPVRAFLYARDRPLSDWAENILRASSASVHYELPWSLYSRLSTKTEPSELIALVKMAEDDLARIPITENLLVIVFDRPSSPGNLGTIIRSCDALGVHGLVITGHSVDLYDPETISATTGSFFSGPTVRLPSQKDLLPWLATLKQQLGRVQVVGSDEKGSVRLDRHDFTGPTILVAGNETWGMSAAYRELCDTVVSIPMQGAASSLNVACATSILLYEVARQRGSRKS